MPKPVNKAKAPKACKTKPYKTKPCQPKNQKIRGFTVLEMLVAAAILSIVIGALLSITQQFLKTSSSTLRYADTISELNDASNYLSNNIRRASKIIPSIKLNGKNCSLDVLPPTLPCFGLIIPESRNGGEIDTYTFLAYKIDARSELQDRLKIEDAWADDNTYIIREYRRVICTTLDSPSNPPFDFPCENPSLISRAQPYMVLEGLSLDAGLVTGTTLAPFIAQGNHLQLNLRLVKRDRDKERYYPANNATSLTVHLRN